MNTPAFTLDLSNFGVQVNKDLDDKRVLLSLYKVNKAGDSRGHGLFANRDIYQNEEVIKIVGPVINVQIINVLYLSYGIDVAIQVGSNKWILPNNESRFVNHSCSPNLGFKGNTTFVAMKNIKKGEELTFDYSMSEISREGYDWVMHCKCESKGCRKKISNTDLFNPKFGLLEKYNGYLPLFVTKRIRQK